MKKRSFTLVELLVVVAILALLVAIAIPAFRNSTNRAQVTADEANRRVLKSAATAYYSDGGSPTTWTSASQGEWGDFIEEWPDHPKDDSEAYKVTIGEGGQVSISPAPLSQKYAGDL